MKVAYNVSKKFKTAIFEFKKSFYIQSNVVVAFNV